VQPPDIGQCVKMMRAGHADFFPSDLRQGLTSLAEAGVKNGEIQPLLPTLQSTGVHLLVSRQQRGAADLIARFNEGLKSLRADGGYERIVQAHGALPPQAVPVLPPQ
jgi:polar amino acid transport system substrate-binding protein